MPAIKLSRRGWTVVGIAVVILAVAGWGIRAGYFPEIGKFFAAEPAGYVPPCAWHGEPITGFSAQCCSGFEPVGLAYAPVPTPATITPPPFPTGDGSLILKVQDPGSLYCTPDGTGYTRTPTYSWSGPALGASNTPVEIMRFSPSRGIFEVVRIMDTQNYASFTDNDLPLPRPLIYQIRLVSDVNIVSNPLEFPVDCLVAQFNSFTTYCAVPTCSAEQRSVNCTKSPCERPVVEMVCPPGVTVPPPRPSYSPTPMPTATPNPSCVPLPRCVYEGEPRCAVDPMPGVIYCPTPTPTTSGTRTPYPPTPYPGTPTPTPIPLQGARLSPDATAVKGPVVPGGLVTVPIVLDTQGYSVTGVKLELRMSGPGEIVRLSGATTDFPETLVAPVVSQWRGSVTVGSGPSSGKSGNRLLVALVTMRVSAAAQDSLVLFVAGPPDSVVTAVDNAGNVLSISGTASFPISGLQVVPGDTDGDGDVDIFDYNAVVSNFGRAGSTGDLDGNGKVDIFDYNLVVSNFGRS